jgi:hypothetical protein
MSARCPVCRNYIATHSGCCPTCAFRADQPPRPHHCWIWVSRWLAALSSAVWVVGASLSLAVSDGFTCLALLLVPLLAISQGRAAELAGSKSANVLASFNLSAWVVAVGLAFFHEKPATPGPQASLFGTACVLIAAISVALAVRVWLKPLKGCPHPLVCAQCGYSLYGLGPKGSCPECGMFFDRTPGLYRE